MLFIAGWVQSIKQITSFRIETIFSSLPKSIHRLHLNWIFSVCWGALTFYDNEKKKKRNTIKTNKTNVSHRIVASFLSVFVYYFLFSVSFFIHFVPPSLCDWLSVWLRDDDVNRPKTRRIKPFYLNYLFLFFLFFCRCFVYEYWLPENEFSCYLFHFGWYFFFRCSNPT